MRGGLTGSEIGSCAGYSDGGKTRNYYVRQLFGGKPNPDVLFSQMIGDSYNYFYSSGQSAGQIIRQNVTMNALRSGSRVMRPAAGTPPVWSIWLTHHPLKSSGWHRPQWGTGRFAHFH